MRKLIRFLAPLAVLFVAIGLIAVLNANKPKPEKIENKERLVSLAVDSVSQENITFSVLTQGEVRARTEVDLVPQVGGRIVMVSPSFAAGGAFKAGETLIQIDDRDYKLAVTRAEARVAEAQVRLQRELADAKIKAKQWREWVKDGSAPTDLALNKPQVAEAQAKLRAAQADLADSQLDLDRTRITLPYDGRVKEKVAGLGQIVSSGTRLGSVFATSYVEIKLPLTDTQLAEVELPIGFIAEKGKEPKVILSANVAGMKRSWSGKIIRTHAAVDNSTRLIYAVAEVEDPYGTARANGMPLAVGLFVKAEIKGVSTTPAYVMPRVALRNGDEVLVVNSDSKLEVRKVTVLSTDMTNLYVSTGVQAGERVVVSSVRKMVDGMKVNAYARSDAAKSAINSAR